MKEEIDPFEKRPDETFTEYHLRKVKLREEYEERFIKQFRDDPKIQEYIKQFHPSSIEFFLKAYVDRKTMAFEFAKFNEKRNEQEDLQWINLAENQLSNIQQKKLFNIQCLWRAEKITIPEIEIAYDFKVWEQYVLDCPFIDPISKEDVELYQRFLEQENMQLELDLLDSWQDYETFKEEGGSSMPEWYEYYDIYKGTSSYINLPDIRGEKESVYLKEMNKHHQKKQHEKAKQKPIDNHPKKFLNSDWDVIKDFAERFEDKLTLKYLKADNRYRESTVDDEEIMNLIKVLINADKPVKFEDAYDWQTSLSKTVDKYKKHKAIDYLPLAFEQHQLSTLTGIKTNIKKKHIDTNSVRIVILNLILDGRESLGEPRNLDF